MYYWCIFLEGKQLGKKGPFLSETRAQSWLDSHDFSGFRGVFHSRSRVWSSARGEVKSQLEEMTNSPKFALQRVYDVRKKEEART